MTKSRNIRKLRHKYTPAEIEIIRARYPHERTENIARDLGLSVNNIYGIAAKLGLVKTPEYLASPDACRLRRGGNVGAQHRFRKGQTPPNKGLRRPGYAPGRMAETQFRKGQRPSTWRPIGTERISKEGYLQVKLTDTGVTRHDFIAVHHLVWELHRGAIPQGHRIAFKDGKKANLMIENLELVTRAELMRRNSYHNNYPKEVAQVIQLRGAVQRKINRRSKNERTDNTTK